MASSSTAHPGYRVHWTAWLVLLALTVAMAYLGFRQAARVPLVVPWTLVGAGAWWIARRRHDVVD
jgi:hypothetical protein